VWLAVLQGYDGGPATETADGHVALLQQPQWHHSTGG